VRNDVDSLPPPPRGHFSHHVPSVVVSSGASTARRKSDAQQRSFFSLRFPWAEAHPTVAPFQRQTRHADSVVFPSTTISLSPPAATSSVVRSAQFPRRQTATFFFFQQARCGDSLTAFTSRFNSRRIRVLFLGPGETFFATGPVVYNCPLFFAVQIRPCAVCDAFHVNGFLRDIHRGSFFFFPQDQIRSNPAPLNLNPATPSRPRQRPVRSTPVFDEKIVLRNRLSLRGDSITLSTSQTVLRGIQPPSALSTPVVNPTQPSGVGVLSR